MVEKATPSEPRRSDPLLKISITELPAIELPEQKRPAFPYPGYRPVREEADVSIALEDQVQKLGSGFDRSSLQSFFRFVWLLNNERHKSLQGYLFKPSQRTGFGSDVLIGAFDGMQDIVTDLRTVKALSSHFADRFRLAVTTGESAAGTVNLTPILTKFGIKSNPNQPGYSLSLKVVSYAENQGDAVVSWRTVISMLAGSLE